MRDLSNIKLNNNDLSGWDFSNQKLEGCSFRYSVIEGSLFTNANVKRADFSKLTANGFSQAQLQSTANYQAHDLSEIRLESNDLSGWDFSNQKLKWVCFQDSVLQGAKFIDANVQGTDFSNTTAKGFSQAQLQSTASYQTHNLENLRFDFNDLSGWDFHNQNLQYTSFQNSTLAGTIFTNSIIEGVDFSNTIAKGFTQSQLQSTASYQNHDLDNIRLGFNDLSGWDFHDQNLIAADFGGSLLSNTNFRNAWLHYGEFWNNSLINTDFSRASLKSASFYSSIENNVNFTEANLISSNFDNTTLNDVNLARADTRGAIGLQYDRCITTNTILSDGTVNGLDLSDHQTLPIYNFVSYLGASPPLPAIPITIQTGMTLGGTGTLEVIFDGKPWNSTIGFEAGIPVDCRGTLNLTFDREANPLAALGQVCRLFDWAGVNPSGMFAVTSEYNWDTSRLYSTGEVALAYSPNLAETKWTGKANGNWNNAGNWTAGVPAAGAVIEFGAASPGHQPFVQNVANPLSLEGILFAPGAGTHYLAGPALKFEGDSPAIACMAKSDQYLGNPLELDADTVVNVTDTGVLNLCGEISGSGGLTKRGGGTLLLANSDNRSGTTTIEEGVLALDTTGQITESPITNDGTFRILGGDHTISSIDGGGTTEVLSGSLTVGSIRQSTLLLGGDSSSASQRHEQRAAPVPEPGMFWLLAAGLAGYP